MDKLDLQLSSNISQAVNTFVQVVGAIGAVIIATKGIFVVPLIPMAYVYNIIQKWFRKTSTELQRVTSITLSPIFSDFSMTISGTPSIRAYSAQTRFFEKCKADYDKNVAAYVLTQLANLWLGLRLDLLSGVFCAFIGAIAVGSPIGFIPAGWLGLSLTYANEVTGFLKHGVRMIATVEADMNAVERIMFYTQMVAPEAPEVIPEKDPKGIWPNRGDINFRNMSMRYREGPKVLKNVSFDIDGGTRIGVVGRTGSGKSSVMIALFRICEIEDGGQILIDGVDTATVGTAALRSNLAIIPQDPVLFSNTIRYNLDPFFTTTDEELWSALKKVQLKDVIANLPKGLEEQISEGGENFSQGQRQLICIARSLLRSPKILIMDEATASIDNQTDAVIQEMIRENFADATILTIAHRLNTIMDSDKVLVLDNGEIAEYDSPQVLLSKSEGIFKDMVNKSKANNSSRLNLAELAEE
mmetsp:Transcript_47258/g.55181  ORF Transcript_47258/g.55181 Transcript_47258/m.55181 type:complete len:470 (+) Transcript_47258:2964-4373(+)